MTQKWVSREQQNGVRRGSRRNRRQRAVVVIGVLIMGLAAGGLAVVWRDGANFIAAMSASGGLALAISRARNDGEEG